MLHTLQHTASGTGRSDGEWDRTQATVPYAAVREWLFDIALPFWAERGVDFSRGGYVEQLRLDGTNPNVDFKRTRVLGRQIYVFSHAALLGFDRGVALARHGYEFLVRNAWLGPDGGWARTLTRDGLVKDATPDLYDLAFVLFALGWFYRATGKPEAIAYSLRTLDFLEQHMRHPKGVGFLAEKPETGARLQNPHMHLLEAALVNLEASGEPRFRALADELVALFQSHFFDSGSSTLCEFFDEDWRPLPGEPGLLTEPGHQFEWAWILGNYQRLTGQDVGRYIRALAGFAEEFGVDPSTGATHSLVRKDGVVVDRGSRVWPNTERIQAAVALFELDRRDPRTIFAQSATLLLDRYFSRCPPGTWIDRLDADGRADADKIPASTLYHVMIAFAEMLRIEEEVARFLQDPFIGAARFEQAGAAT